MKPKPETAILGISADYHDAAAALVVDGKIVAAAEEERFTRVKHDARLPEQATSWCLDDAGLEVGDLDAVVFYAKPFSTYERIVSVGARAGVRGLPTFVGALGAWSRRKLWVGYRIERMLRALGGPVPPVQFSEHHLSHAASAFYPSPFASAAIITLDGVGEWTTASIGRGAGNRIELLDELRYPDSVGIFYSALTAFCGFAVNDGEYKLMGLAPYGRPTYVDVLRREVVHVAEDGSIALDPRWFDHQAGARMTRPALATLLDGPPRSAEGPLTEREADIARSVQVILEDILVKVGQRAFARTGERSVCLAGGVAHNCVAVAALAERGPFDDVWVQPAAGDSGGAIGAAMWLLHDVLDAPRPDPQGGDGMSGALLGPRFDGEEVSAWLTANGIAHERPRAAEVDDLVADALASGAVVGWFDGRMEFGPRALGSRSILADPRDPTVVGRVNQLVKGREGFRPFAPAVLAESAQAWFQVDRPLPYMTMTATVHADRWVEHPVDAGASFAARLATPSSTIPGCTHVDRTARVQTVAADTNPRFHALLRAFERRSGCPVLLNTSFNRRDEPIVCTPRDAYRCFEAAGLDLLVIEGCVVRSGAVADGEVAS